mgnify:CR=1 FL=1
MKYLASGLIEYVDVRSWFTYWLRVVLLRKFTEHTLHTLNSQHTIDAHFIRNTHNSYLVHAGGEAHGGSSLAGREHRAGGGLLRILENLRLRSAGVA